MASLSHINPGDGGKITAKIDTKGRIGAVSKSVQVFSNDPKRPIVTLYLKAGLKK
jgi:hypothetical protein